MRRPVLLSATILAAMVSPTFAGGAPAQLNVVVRHLQDPQIQESSGIATSSYFPGVLFTHNDSGDTSRFFAVGPDGLTKAVFTLAGAQSWDWEDMTKGPDSSLWLGDIGDNQLRKSSVCVFRVAEPTILASASLPYTRYDFRYDDGRSHNAEALLVNPQTGTLYIATKAKSGAGIYQAPSTLSTTGYNTLRRVASAPALVTGGDFTADGSRLVLRTHSKAYLYSGVGGAATVVDLPAEKQGESVTFVQNGASLLVGSEGNDSPVWRVSVPGP